MPKGVKKSSRKERVKLCNSDYYGYMGSKGISPLIATVLVIGFVIVIAAMLFMWGGGFVKKIKDEQKIKSNVNLKCSIGLTKTDVTAERVTGGIVVSINNKDKEKVAGVNIRLYDSGGKVVHKAFSVVETKEYGAKKYGVKCSSPTCVLNNIVSVGVFPLVEGDKKGNNKKLYPCSDKEIKANVIARTGTVETAATIAVEGTTGNIDVTGCIPDKCASTNCVTGAECSSTTCCPVGFKCVDSTCVVDKCKSDTECKQGGCQLKCKDERCVAKDIREGCVQDCDCGAFFCTDGKCSNVKTCNTNADCSSIPLLNGFGWVCRGSSCVTGGQSDGKINDVCLVNADCTNGLLCKSGKCSNCASYAECGTGKICRSGNCVVGGLSDGDAGADCSAGADCKSGNCYSGKCCAPNCAGKTCGDNGCGRSCGTCNTGYVCQSGQCSACVPKTCVYYGNPACGSYSDGCSGTINCGTCPTGKTCSGGQCVCNNQCSSGSLRCSSNNANVEKCAQDANGCWTQWITDKTCPEKTTCRYVGGSFGYGCVCNHECNTIGETACGLESEEQIYIYLRQCTTSSNIDYSGTACRVWSDTDCLTAIPPIQGYCDWHTAWPLYIPAHCDDFKDYNGDDIPTSYQVTLEYGVATGNSGYIFENGEYDYIKVMPDANGYACVKVYPSPASSINLDIYAEKGISVDFSPPDWSSASRGAGGTEIIGGMSGIGSSGAIVKVDSTSGSGWYMIELCYPFV